METKGQNTDSIIRYKNYIMYPCDVENSRDRFDLYRVSVGKKGKSIGKDTEIFIGYGLRLEEAIDKMIRNDLSHKGINDLKTYCQEFMKAKNEIKNLLK
jgi:hypothetical protein